jgi:hypothetical protein
MDIDAKILNKILANNSTTCQKSYTMIKSVSFLECRDGLTDINP